jgi:hypothetical protein
MKSRSEHDPAVMAYRTRLEEVGSLVAFLVADDPGPDEDTLPGEDENEHDHDHREDTDR